MTPKCRPVPAVKLLMTPHPSAALSSMPNCMAPLLYATFKTRAIVIA